MGRDLIENRKSKIANPKMGAGGFEPPKALPSDLQSDPFVHSGTLPGIEQLTESPPNGQGGWARRAQKGGLPGGLRVGGRCLTNDKSYPRTDRVLPLPLSPSASPGEIAGESNTMFTGPSASLVMTMWAPKTPSATGQPLAAKAATTC